MESRNLTLNRAHYRSLRAALKEKSGQMQKGDLNIRLIRALPTQWARCTTTSCAIKMLWNVSSPLAKLCELKCTPMRDNDNRRVHLPPVHLPYQFIYPQSIYLPLHSSPTHFINFYFTSSLHKNTSSPRQSIRGLWGSRRDYYIANLT